MKKFTVALCLAASIGVYGQKGAEPQVVSSTTDEKPKEAEEIPLNKWFSDYLKEKDTPDWITHYIIALDSRIRNTEACSFFRRFIADSNTRSDTVKRFVEYLSVVGYPISKIIENDANVVLNVNPYDIYKAIYFAITYTIIDGLPVGPEPIPSNPPERVAAPSTEIATPPENSNVYTPYP